MCTLEFLDLRNKRLVEAAKAGAGVTHTHGRLAVMSSTSAEAHDLICRTAPAPMFDCYEWVVNVQYPFFFHQEIEERGLRYPNSNSNSNPAT